MSQALLQLGDLPLVLDQPQLGEHPGEVGVAALVAGDLRVHAGVHPAQHPGLRRPGTGGRTGRRCAGSRTPSEAEISLQRRAAAGPELAVLPVAEELVGLARAARPGVEDGLAALDHEHRVAGLVAAEVGVRGLGPEPVVGVVGADLEAARRDHQSLARELLGQPLAASPRPRRDRVGRQVELAVAPAGAHERGVGLGHCRVVALGDRSRCRRSRERCSRWGPVSASLTVPLYDRGIVTLRACRDAAAPPRSPSSSRS